MTSTHLESVLLQLREMIMRGEFPVGSRLMEIPIAQRLNVSRTPVRLALQALAQEGLLVYMPQRGFVVKAYTVKEIVDAVDVRGRLEAMACAMLAGIGLSHEQTALIERNLADTRLLAERQDFGPADAEAWRELNGFFHENIVEWSGNQSLTRMVRQFDPIPLVAARNVAATNSNLARIQYTVQQNVYMHALIFDAIRLRQAERAELLMREHVYQGREALREVLERMAQPSAQAASDVPMLRLVADNN